MDCRIFCRWANIFSEGSPKQMATNSSPPYRAKKSVLRERLAETV